MGECILHFVKLYCVVAVYTMSFCDLWSINVFLFFFSNSKCHLLCFSVYLHKYSHIRLHLNWISAAQTDSLHFSRSVSACFLSYKFMKKIVCLRGSCHGRCLHCFYVHVCPCWQCSWEFFLSKCEDVVKWHVVCVFLFTNTYFEQILLNSSCVKSLHTL